MQAGEAKPYTFMWCFSGIMILLAAIMGVSIETPSSARNFVKLDTIYNLRFTFLTIITVVATANANYSGMNMSIAKMLVSVTDGLPRICTIAGALGAFITGSGTNSNVLFGPCRRRRLRTGASAAWLAACNSAGAGWK